MVCFGRREDRETNDKVKGSGLGGGGEVCGVGDFEVGVELRDGLEEDRGGGKRGLEERDGRDERGACRRWRGPS